jgi:hypothetical protein
MNSIIIVIIVVAVVIVIDYNVQCNTEGSFIVEDCIMKKLYKMCNSKCINWFACV